jgi:hypothetical protein
VVTVFFVLAAPAEAHDRLGRAQPRVDAAVSGEAAARALSIVLTDLDSGDPIPDATVDVTASLGRDEAGLVRLGVREGPPGTYASALELPRSGRWRVDVRISGAGVAPARFQLDVDVAGTGRSRRSSDRSYLPYLIGVPLALGFLAAAILIRARSRRSRA